jgi:hypothetical protein
MHPELFDLRPGPPRVLVRLYLAYSRIRARLPLRLLDVIDAHPVPFAVVFGPYLLAYDGLVQTAAKYRLRHRARRAMPRRFIRRASGAPKRPNAAGEVAQPRP